MVNDLVLAVLRSLLRRVIDRRVCALRFRGRRTGRIITLPVEYVWRGRGQLVVLAGRGRGKTWWRNFTGAHDLEVRLDGRWHPATATALRPGDPGRPEAIAVYRAANARVRADTEDPVVTIDLDASPPPGPGLWARWFRAVTAGECLGFLVPAAVGALTAHAVTAVSVPLLVLAGAAEGATLGWFQARVLRRVLPRLSVARWTAATAGAAALAWALGLAPTAVDLAGLPPAALVPIVAAGGLVLLFSIGVAQWAVLRAHVRGAGRWIWGTALAWTIALGLFVAVTTPLWQPGQPIAVTVLIGVLGGLVMAAAVAALTGWLAVRVTGRTPPPYGARRISSAARKPDSTAPSR